MDAFLYQILSFWSNIFMVLWFGMLGVILYFASSKQKDNETVKRRVKFIIIGIVVFIAILFGASAAYHQNIRSKFTDLVKNPPQVMLLNKGDKTLEFKNDPRIKEFLNLVFQSSSVMSHHSHPLEPVIITLPDQGYVLSLGHDSQVKNEYWLKFDKYPAWKENHKAEVIVKQFSSADMTAWLKDNGFEP